MNKKVYLSYASLFVCAALYFIWPTTHTIALRKILLVIGAAIGLGLWIKDIDRKKIFKAYWTIYLILLLVWVVFHVIFLSKNGTEAWSEFTGQWLPPYIAALSGIGLGLASRNISTSIFRYYLISVFAMSSVLYVIMSLIINISSGHLIINYWGVTDHKLSLTFYANILAALSYSKIVDAFKFNEKVIIKLFWLLIVGLAIYVSIFSGSLNGVLLLGICSTVAIALIVDQKRGDVSRIVIAVPAILLVAFILYAISFSTNVNTHWNKLVVETKLAENLDSPTNWRNVAKYPNIYDEHGEWIEYASSYYLRFAYANAGFREIIENPWGYGVTRHAFERLVQKKYPNENISIANSHNGYIDLVCAVGFPALFFMILAIVAVYRQLNKSNSEWARPAAWILGIILLHWAIDPISRDHYFETYLFLIGLFATLTINNSPVTADARQS